MINTHHPYTSIRLIDATLTSTHLQSRLFADNAAPDIDLLFYDTNQANAISFFLDRYWDRIIFGQHSGNWIKSYGDHTGQYQFEGAKAMTVDQSSNKVYVADTENGRIVKLGYNAGALSYVSDFTLPGVVHPVDISLPYMAFTMWVADDVTGKLVECDRNGIAFHTVEYYTIGAQTYRLNRPRNVLRMSLFNQLGFVDAERNTFVACNSTAISGTTITALSSTEFTQLGPSLTSIGEDITQNWWVADKGLGMVHFFDWSGEYLASTSCPTPPEGVSTSPWYWDGQYLWRVLDIYTAEPWSNSTGLRAYLPGFDVIDMQMQETESQFEFRMY